MPAVTEALITGLEKRFSSDPPKSSESPNEMYVRAGQAEVIAYLRYVCDEQNTGIKNQESTDVFLKAEATQASQGDRSSSRRRHIRRSTSG